jgi:ankyrin repeat protein
MKKQQAGRVVNVLGIALIIFKSLCAMECSLQNSYDDEKEGGSDLSYSDQNGDTVLHLAVQKNSTEGVRKILEREARERSFWYKLNCFCNNSVLANVKNKKGETPLHCCVYKKQVNEKILLLLVNYGAALNVRDDNFKRPVDYVKEGCNNSCNNSYVIKILTPKDVDILFGNLGLD